MSVPTARSAYALAVRCALVAGVFSFVVAALLLADLSSRVAKDPLNTPEYAAVKAELAKSPTDEALQGRLREMDRELRAAYFARRRFTDWGTWLLLGGIVVTALFAKWAAVLDRRLPHPLPLEGADDPVDADQTRSRRALAGLGVAVLLLMLLLLAGFRSVLPSDAAQLAAMLEQDAERAAAGSGDPRRAPGAEGARPAKTDIKPTPDKNPVPEKPAPEPKAKSDSPPPEPNSPFEDEPKMPAKPDGEAKKPEPPKPPEKPTPTPPEKPAPAKTDAKPAFVAQGLPDLAAGFPTDEELKANWPKFRGPDGSGIAAGADYPTKWDVESGDGIRWKVEIPLPGTNSPVVWDKRLFLTGATEDKRQVQCFDTDTGKLLWAKDVADATGGDPPKVEKSTGYAAATAVTDGRRVYAIFATGDLVAFDFEGNLRWSRTFGRLKNTYGLAASLVMHQDLLIVPLDQGNKRDKMSKYLAVKAANGETVWEAPREVPNSWTSPIVVRHDGKPLLVTAADPWAIGYSATDGKELWRVECLQGDVAPSPVYAGGLVFVAMEFPGLTAIRAGGEGNVTDSHIAWQSDMNAPDTCSPLATEKFALILSTGGMLTCFDAKKGGEPLWEHEFDDASFNSSPGMAGPNVYVFDEEGKVFIVAPTEKECREVAECSMGEGVVASPVFVGGRIYLRGKKHLFCIGSK